MSPPFQKVGEHFPLVRHQISPLIKCKFKFQGLSYPGSHFRGNKEPYADPNLRLPIPVVQAVSQVN